MSNYQYAITIKLDGYADVSFEELSQCEKDKKFFVIYHLSSTLKAAKCGWENCEYRVMETPAGTRTEFLVLWAEDVGNSGSRWINVTGDSLGAVMCEMCDNLW